MDQEIMSHNTEQMPSMLGLSDSQLTDLKPSTTIYYDDPYQHYTANNGLVPQGHHYVELVPAPTEHMAAYMQTMPVALDMHNRTFTSSNHELIDNSQENTYIASPNSNDMMKTWWEPSAVRRRNERERLRVRNVNSGFMELRNKLPLTDKERSRRLSKVEILRLAIDYIKNLQGLAKTTRK